MRNYLKKKEDKDVLSLSADELISKTFGRNRSIIGNSLKLILLLCMVLPLVCAGFVLKNRHTGSELEDVSIISFASAPAAETSAKKDLISIPAGTVKANPFLPYRDIGGTSVSDVPQFDLVAPPEVVNENSDAARVMDTIVSGILYDKYSPSAILNIEGNDYLVKKGDTVNNYKVVSIMQDSVTVMLGSNTYKAGIGEILTEGTLNHNDVSNLNKKFGGERR